MKSNPSSPHQRTLDREVSSSQVTTPGVLSPPSSSSSSSQSTQLVPPSLSPRHHHQQQPDLPDEYSEFEEPYVNVLDLILHNPDLPPISAEHPYNEVDALVFSTLVYLPMIYISSLKPNSEEEETAAGRRPHKISRFAYKTIRACLTGDPMCPIRADEQHNFDRYKVAALAKGREFDTLRLAGAVCTCTRYKDIVVSDFEGVYEYDPSECLYVQFAAAIFTLPDGAKVVSIRGTDGTLAGWREDLAMSYGRVDAQHVAHQYFVEVVQKYPDAKIALTGHSKGGHLAVYAALAEARLTEHLADFGERTVINFDGPGLRREIIADLSVTFSMIGGKISTYVPQTSIMGILLNNKRDIYRGSYHYALSSSQYILQHDTFSWLLHPECFTTGDGVDRFVAPTGRDTDDVSKAIERVVDSYLATYNPPYIKMAATGILDILENEEGLFPDSNMPLSVFYEYIINFLRLPPEIRDAVRVTFQFFALGLMANIKVSGKNEAADLIIYGSVLVNAIINSIPVDAIKNSIEMFIFLREHSQGFKIAQIIEDLLMDKDTRFIIKSLIAFCEKVIEELNSVKDVLYDVSETSYYARGLSIAAGLEKVLTLCDSYVIPVLRAKSYGEYFFKTSKKPMKLEKKKLELPMSSSSSSVIASTPLSTTALGSSGSSASSFNATNVNQSTAVTTLSASSSSSSQTAAAAAAVVTAEDAYNRILSGIFPGIEDNLIRGAMRQLEYDFPRIVQWLSEYRERLCEKMVQYNVIQIQQPQPSYPPTPQQLTEHEAEIATELHKLYPDVDERLIRGFIRLGPSSARKWLDELTSKASDLKNRGAAPGFLPAPLLAAKATMVNLDCDCETKKKFVLDMAHDSFPQIPIEELTAIAEEQNYELDRITESIIKREDIDSPITNSSILPPAIAAAVVGPPSSSMLLSPLTSNSSSISPSSITTSISPSSTSISPTSSSSSSSSDTRSCNKSKSSENKGAENGESDGSVSKFFSKFFRGKESSQKKSEATQNVKTPPSSGNPSSQQITSPRENALKATSPSSSMLPASASSSAPLSAMDLASVTLLSAAFPQKGRGELIDALRAARGDYEKAALNILFGPERLALVHNGKKAQPPPLFDITLEATVVDPHILTYKYRIEEPVGKDYIALFPVSGRWESPVSELVPTDPSGSGEGSFRVAESGLYEARILRGKDTTACLARSLGVVVGPQVALETTVNSRNTIVVKYWSQTGDIITSEYRKRPWWIGLYPHGEPSSKWILRAKCAESSDPGFVVMKPPRKYATYDVRFFLAERAPLSATTTVTIGSVDRMSAEKVIDPETHRPQLVVKWCSWSVERGAFDWIGVFTRVAGSANANAVVSGGGGGGDGDSDSDGSDSDIEFLNGGGESLKEVAYKRVSDGKIDSESVAGVVYFDIEKCKLSPGRYVLQFVSKPILPPSKILMETEVVI